MQDFIDKGNSFNLYQGIKELVGPTRKPLNILEKDNGERIENVKDRLEHWGKYFETLFNQETKTDISALDNLSLSTENPPGDNPPSRDEVVDALMSLNNKSAGNDNIIAEMLKAGQETTVDLLYELLQKIWAEKSIPKEWTEALVIPIFKKGKKSRCENYRGISLLSVPSKLLTKIIYNRLYPYIDTLLRDTQCGFRREKSTIDMIFTSRQLIEKAIEQNTSLSIRFIDIQKAFDTVDREILYKILEKTKCPPTTLEILKSLHTETKSRVRTENETSPHL